MNDKVDLKERFLKTFHTLEADRFDEAKISEIKKSFDVFLDDYYAQNNACFYGPKYQQIELAYDVIENSKVVVFEWTTSPELPTKYVSENITQFGYLPEDFYSGPLKDYWDFVFEEDRAKVKEDIYKARETGLKELKHSYRIVTKNKTVKWVEERIIFERDDDGQLLSEKGIVLDITEIKTLENELVKNKEKYERIFEHSSAIISTFDINGKINSVNKTFCNTTGYTKEELKTMNIFDVIEPKFMETKQIQSDNLLNLIEAMDSKSNEIRVHCKNKEDRTFSITTNLLYNNGEAIEIEAVAIDISDKKIAENRITYLSYHDKLTGAYNRAYFEETLDELDESEDYPFSIIIGDMNGLKEVNDIFGHKEGDNLLVKMAKIFKASCRNSDIVARFGGDEFAIICPNTTEAGAMKICQRIRDNCEAQDPYSPLKPSIALGYASKHEAGILTDDVIRLADDKMYRNKLTLSQSRRSNLITTLQSTLEEKTLETKEHAQRIEEISLKLGQHLGFEQDKLDELSIAALMHDIGKVGIPDTILLKEEPLTDNEFEIIKKHAEIGCKILKTSTTTKEIGTYVLHHHERWDGMGYPSGLKQDAIPLISRIIAIADVYDAMISKRCYKDASCHHAAIEEIKKCSGSKFDPTLVELFVDLMH